jgi:hypothetical protein
VQRRVARDVLRERFARALEQPGGVGGVEVRADSPGAPIPERHFN